ncbi:hypothetical protein GOBAR_DD23105 [Gossypium barbadense]|nr:hypothetical protein GOBAR_DD23105 [Gossypium barbadense]
MYKLENALMVSCVGVVARLMTKIGLRVTPSNTTLFLWTHMFHGERPGLSFLSYISNLELNLYSDSTYAVLREIQTKLPSKSALAE